MKVLSPLLKHPKTGITSQSKAISRHLIDKAFRNVLGTRFHTIFFFSMLLFIILYHNICWFNTFSNYYKNSIENKNYKLTLKDFLQILYFDKVNMYFIYRLFNLNVAYPLRQFDRRYHPLDVDINPTFYSSCVSFRIRTFKTKLKSHKMYMIFE